MNNQLFKMTLLTLVLLLCGATFAAQAATFTVTNTNDSGAGSLRQAILNANAANDADQIVFDPTLFGSAQTINLTNGLTITNPVTITGTGARLLTVRRSNNAAFAIFTINNGSGTVRISGMTISNGGPVQFGGGVTNNGGALTLDGVTVSGTVGGADSAVDNQSGTMTIINSLISNNTSIGLLVDGGTVNVANTTFSGNNDAFNQIGAVATFPGNTINLNNVTITNNQPVGINNQDAGPGTFNIRNTIIAGNTQDIRGAFVSRGNNLIGNTTGGSGFTQPSDKTNVAANLGALANNGGQTNTHLPNPGSPAIDAGNNCVVNSSCGTNNPPVNLTTDQRGTGFPRQNGTAVDIGAAETAGPTAAGVSISGRVSVGGRGLTNAVVYLTDQNGETRAARTSTFGYFRFEDVAAGETYIVQVVSKRYFFTPQVLSVSEDITNLTLTAQNTAKTIR